MSDEQVYVIPDPSNWIISSRAVMAQDPLNAHPHLVSFNLLDDDYNEVIASLASFNYLPLVNPDFVEDEMLDTLSRFAHNAIAAKHNERPTTTKVCILVNHPNINLAHSIVKVFMDVPLLLGMETVTAIATDNTVWDDVLLVRAGLVNNELVTNHQLDVIVNGSNAGIFKNGE